MIELPLQPSHGQYTLRKAIAEDAGFVFALVEACFCSTYEDLYGQWDRERSKATASFMIDQGAYIIQVDGEDAGFLRCYERAPGRAELGEIELLPKYRNKGVGSRLMVDLLAVMDELGISIQLQVLLDNPAMRLYERLGFAQTHYVMYRRARTQ